MANIISKIEKSIASHEALINILSAELKKAVLHSMWQCPRCKKRSKLSSIKLEMPLTYSYIDEDWQETQLQAQCPKCNQLSWPGMAKKNFELINKYKHLLAVASILQK